MTVQSPLTSSTDVRLVKKLDVSQVISRYQAEFGINVSAYFKGMTELPVYECNQTKLRFYYPFSLAGDGAFYAELSQRYGGYYNPWKWEHEQVFQRLKAGDRVLEIGCGNGYFLKRLPEKGATGIGLELNDEAIKAGERLGVTIRNQPLEAHAQEATGQYDVVCAFQVFEHVNEVGAFFRQALACLKPGGLLAIGVPNNDSFYFSEDPYHTLNLPPHHMLLWHPEALRNAAGVMKVSVEAIEVEAATTVHKSIAYRLWLDKTLGKGTASTFLYKTTRFIAKRLPVFTEGATVVAIYRK